MSCGFLQLWRGSQPPSPTFHSRWVVSIISVTPHRLRLAVCTWDGSRWRWKKCGLSKTGGKCRTRIRMLAWKKWCSLYQFNTSFSCECESLSQNASLGGVCWRRKAPELRLASRRWCHDWRPGGQRKVPSGATFWGSLAPESCLPNKRHFLFINNHHLTSLHPRKVKGWNLNIILSALGFHPLFHFKFNPLTPPPPPPPPNPARLGPFGDDHLRIGCP